MAEANGAAVQMGMVMVTSTRRSCLHIENSSRDLPDYASTAGNRHLGQVACRLWTNANGHDILMSLCGDSSAAAAVSELTLPMSTLSGPHRHARRINGTVATVADQGQLDQTSYNDASPADDLMGDYLERYSSTYIHDKLDDDLRTWGGGSYGRRTMGEQLLVTKYLSVLRQGQSSTAATNPACVTQEVAEGKVWRA